MRDRIRPDIWLLIAVPILFALFAGVVPRPVGLDRALKGARVALESGDLLSASHHFVTVLEYQPWRVSLWETAGRAALEGGDPQRAADYLELAAARGQITPQGILYLGDAYFQSGDLEAALETWQLALERGGDPLPTYTRMLEAHRRQKNYPAAIQDLQNIAQLQPQNAQIRYQLGLMLATRQPEAALAHLLAAVEINQELAEAVQLLQRSLRAAAQTDDPAYTLLNAGRALAFLDEWELAAEAFSQAVQANPDYAEAWAFLGEAQEQTGQDGLPALQKALELNPYSLTANLLFGLYHKRNGRPEMALVYFHAAASIEPENPAVQAEIGNTLAVLGDFNKALAYYRRATELAPREATYWHLLSLFALQNGVQIEEVGLAAARQALLLNENDPAALDLMGYGYYLLNDMALAQRFLRRSLDVDPNYASARLHLGLVYLAQGDQANARQQLAKAIQLAPGTPVARQAERILQRYFP